MNPILCPDSIPAFLNFFDVSIAPPLLFYTYGPTILISLFLGIFVLIKDKKSLASKLLFLIAISFSLWVLDIFILWIAAYNDAVMYGWQMTPVFEVPLFLFSLYFAYVITDKERKDIGSSLKLLFIVIMFVVFLILPTQLNIVSYNIGVCEGIPGHFWDYMYSGEMVIIAWILGLCLGRFRRLQKGDPHKKQILTFGAGIVSFLILFNGSNLVGQITGIQEISFIGSLGMTIFLGFLAYMIVKFQTFNTKVFAAQALIFSIGVLIVAMFFVQQIEYLRFVLIGTLVLFIPFGYQLIRSVKREISQREKIQVLADDLSKANSSLEGANERLKELDKLKSEFVSLATHHISTPLTAIKGYASLLQEGDYGEISSEKGKVLNRLEHLTDNLVSIVRDFLDVSQIEKGDVKYSFAKVQMQTLTENVLSKYRNAIERKGLYLKYSNSDVQDCIFFADQEKLRQAIGNIIENCIKYTAEGEIKVDLSSENDQILLIITDAGERNLPVMSPKLAQKFTKSGDEKEASIVGNGLGIYVAKQIVEAHGGEFSINNIKNKTDFIIKFRVKS